MNHLTAPTILTPLIAIRNSFLLDSSLLFSLRHSSAWASRHDDPDSYSDPSSFHPIRPEFSTIILYGALLADSSLNTRCDANLFFRLTLNESGLFDLYVFFLSGSANHRQMSCIMYHRHDGVLIVYRQLRLAVELGDTV